MSLDKNVDNYTNLITPNYLLNKYNSEITSECIHFVNKSRTTIENIISGKDPRLLVVCGPCSIHDVNATIDYAKKLYDLKQKYSSELYVVIRLYFEKPRTTVGWKGFINDPHINESFDINYGLEEAFKLMLNIINIGLPIGTELLDTNTTQYFSHFISWGAIGARTVESQLHRQLVSGCSFPVGFKNTTDGNIQSAIDACVSSTCSHHFIGMDYNCSVKAISTTGNKYTHIILRGSNKGPNYYKEDVSKTLSLLKSTNDKLKTNNSKNIHTKIMIDCSHGNSMKLEKNQRKVVNYIKDEIPPNMQNNILGVMIESNLVSGNQKIPSLSTNTENNKFDKFGNSITHKSLIYGLSITDKCIDLEETKLIFEELKLIFINRLKVYST